MSTLADIRTEPTPNPNALKFLTGQVLLAAGSIDFPTREQAETSPLAKALFTLAGVQGVFIASDFVTVSKEPNFPWAILTPQIMEKIQAMLASGTPLVTYSASDPISQASSETPVGEQTTEAKIRAILDNEIRPAVAMDGGDVVFDSYENGVVKLHLQGACSSCPSSIMTLKAGVENRLKMEIPEIKEVVQI